MEKEERMRKRKRERGLKVLNFGGVLKENYGLLP